LTSEAERARLDVIRRGVERMRRHQHGGALDFIEIKQIFLVQFAIGTPKVPKAKKVTLWQNVESFLYE
jgi:hypothetical protein